MFLALAVACTTAAAGSRTALVYPTSVAIERSGSLLVVENGLRRLVRIDTEGHVRKLAALTKPFAAIETSNGRIFVTDGPSLERIDPGRPPVTLTTVGADIGPLAASKRGDLFFTTATRLYRLRAGARRPTRVAAGVKLANPHGIAVAPNGDVLVSDTDHGRIVRIGARGASTFARIAHPRGLAIGADGAVYVVAADAKRIVRFRRDRRRSFVGPRFGDPYALALAPHYLEVVDTGPSGTIRRVAIE